MLGRRSKLAIYLVSWALVGIVLLSIPALVSPFTEKAQIANPSGNPSPTTLGTNRNTTYSFRISSPNSSVTASLSNSYNSTFTIQTDSATNITITAYNGNVNAWTITSTSPANVTVTPKTSNSYGATSNSISSNVPDFVFRLSLLLAPAVVLSGLGMVRVRRRFNREFDVPEN